MTFMLCAALERRFAGLTFKYANASTQTDSSHKMKKTLTCKKRTIHMLLAAAVAALLLPACQKQDGFKMADVNGDGRISPTEFQRYMLEQIFEAYDVNGDGKVTYAEWKEANPSGDEKKFHLADFNHDGMISPMEAKAYYDETGDLQTLFSKIDTNHDGFISRDEASAFFDKLVAQPGATTRQKLSNFSKP
jgi:hypothetical protein